MRDVRRAVAVAVMVGVALVVPAATPAAAAPARTFYVSPTGSDGGPGTQSAPWKTLARASSANLDPGDQVLLQGGATFSGTLRLTAEDAGTAASPVTIDSYGTGRATISSGAAQGVAVYNTSGIVVRNLNVVGAGPGSGGDVGVLVYSDLPGDVLLPYVRLSDLEVSGYRDFGVAIGSWNLRSGFRDVRVERLASHDNGDSGFVTYAQSPNVHKDLYVGDSRFYDNQGQPESTKNSGSGLVLGGVDTAIVERNLAYRNGGLNTVINGGVGIWAYSSTRLTFQRNESYQNRTGSAADGGGFNLDHDVSHSVMQLNYSHDNQGNGFMLAHNLDTTVHTGNVIRYNVSQNDGRKNGTSSLRVWGKVSGDIYHNTFSLSAATGTPKAVRIDGKPGAKVRIRNNIFRTKGGMPLIVVSGAQANATNLVFQGNDWYATTAPKFTWGTRNFTSLAGWRTAIGVERVGTTAVGSAANPLFVGGDAPTYGDPARLPELRGFYNLSAGSTVADKGVNLAAFGITPSPTDFSGSPSPKGAAPDPGAFER